MIDAELPSSIRCGHPHHQVSWMEVAKSDLASPKSRLEVSKNRYDGKRCDYADTHRTFVQMAGYLNNETNAGNAKLERTAAQITRIFLVVALSWIVSRVRYQHKPASIGKTPRGLLPVSAEGWNHYLSKHERKARRAR